MQLLISYHSGSAGNTNFKCIINAVIRIIVSSSCFFKISMRVAQLHVFNKTASKPATSVVFEVFCFTCKVTIVDKKKESFSTVFACILCIRFRSLVSDGVCNVATIKS